MNENSNYGQLFPIEQKNPEVEGRFVAVKSCFFVAVAMPFLGSYFLPHGVFLLQPRSVTGFEDDCEELHHGCLKVAEKLAASGAEHLVLLTPHGLALKEHFCVYMNSAAEVCPDD